MPLQVLNKMLCFKSSPWYVPLLFLHLILLVELTLSIQDYNEQDQLGYKCSASASSCPAQLVFLAEKGRSLQDISDQFQVPVSTVLSANSIDNSTSTSTIDQLLLIPVPCACKSTTNRSSASVLSTVQHGDTFFSLATDRFRFLTTFPAIEASNVGMIFTNITPGDKVAVPLRCACSDRKDRLLVTYVVSKLDPSAVVLSSTLDVELQQLLEENNLPPNAKLQPGTTLLIPVEKTSLPPVLKLPAVPAASPPPLDAPSTAGSEGQEWKFYLGISCAAVGIILLAFTVLLVIVHRKRRKMATAKSSETILERKVVSPFLSPKNSSTRSNAAKLSMPDVLDAVKPTWYSLQELRDATNDFDRASIIPGASSMYAAVLRGKKVAIKKTDDGTAGTRVLSRVHHANLIALVGACHDELTNQTFLAYEFAENGSLRDCLSAAAAARRSSVEDNTTTAAPLVSDNSAASPQTTAIQQSPLHAWNGSDRASVSSDSATFSSSPLKPAVHPKGVILDWKTRLQIALDVARGLEYLHNYARPGFVHKNIRTSNVLLDKDFHAKLSSFHKAMESGKILENPSVDSTTTVFADIDHHSLGYKAPEYLLHGTVSTKTDVYAFGVVLLELLTGLEPVIDVSARRISRAFGRKSDPVALADAIVPGLDGEPDSLLEWIDPALLQARGAGFSVEDAATLAFLARTCLERDPRKRPTMRDIAWALSQMRGESPLT